MKIKFFTISIIILSSLVLSSCIKNSQDSESKVEYLDLTWIWLGENYTLDCAAVWWCENEEDYPGIHREAYVYFRGDKLSVPVNFYNDNVDQVDYGEYKCKWIHYYENDSYIEFEEVEKDEIESLDVADYMIEYLER
jgi:hypothetical protein